MKPIPTALWAAGWADQGVIQQEPGPHLTPRGARGLGAGRVTLHSDLKQPLCFQCLSLLICEIIPMLALPSIRELRIRSNMRVKVFCNPQGV